MKPFVIATMLMTTVLPVSANWFNGADSLILAHQKLLEGNTSASFDAMIEVLQRSSLPEKESHVSDLLNLAITEDCGRSLTKSNMPDWLPNLRLRREMVQTPNRIYHRLLIAGESTRQLVSVKLSRWPDTTVLERQTFNQTGNTFSFEVDGLSSAISAGLYKLDLQVDAATKDNQFANWSSWLIITQPTPLQKISWQDARSWYILQQSETDAKCEKPYLAIALESKPLGSAEPIWSVDIHHNLPSTLPKIDVPEGRYWLSVSLIEKRWQGIISIEEVQRIVRTVELPDVDVSSLTTGKSGDKLPK
ncbi:DUF2861 family protein [Veronia pacifica]|nr:DUF2861 family protein [Veronia pacifica]